VKGIRKVVSKMNGIENAIDTDAGSGSCRRARPAVLDKLKVRVGGVEPRPEPRATAGRSRSGWSNKRDPCAILLSARLLGHRRTSTSDRQRARTSGSRPSNPGRPISSTICEAPEQLRR
jgi:hypothetical protein